MMAQLKLNSTIQSVLRKHGQYTCVVHFGSKLSGRVWRSKKKTEGSEDNITKDGFW